MKNASDFDRSQARAPYNRRENVYEHTTTKHKSWREYDTIVIFATTHLISRRISAYMISVSLPLVLLEYLEFESTGYMSLLVALICCADASLYREPCRWISSFFSKATFESADPKTSPCDISRCTSDCIVPGILVASITPMLIDFCAELPCTRSTSLDRIFSSSFSLTL